MSIESNYVRTKAQSDFSAKVRAILYGVALGDALGAPVEKLSAAEIAQRYGKVESIHTEWHRMTEHPDKRNGRIRGAGIVTDDTLMTLCLMEIYQEQLRHLDAWDMAESLVKKITWEKRWIPEMQKDAPLIERLFYPEKWIFMRLQLAACDPRQGGIGNMVNCGAAMYIAPIGIVNAANPVAAYSEAIHFASGHQQSYGLEAAGVLAACIAAALIPNSNMEIVLDAALSVAKDGTKDAIADLTAYAKQCKGQNIDYLSFANELHRLIKPYSPMGDDVHHGAHKSGKATHSYQPSRLFSIEELPIALAFCVLHEDNFKQAIIDGINSGRDTDSIGVMAGAILGAIHSEKVIDNEILSQINKANKLDLFSSADQFSLAAQKIIQNDIVSIQKNVLDQQALLNKI